VPAPETLTFAADLRAEVQARAEVLQPEPPARRLEEEESCLKAPAFLERLTVAAERH
jgi:hypothetical protein